MLLQVVFFAIVAAVYAEAEAEADPALLYAAPYGYAAAPYAYGAYGLAATPFKSAPCVNAANVPVPCAAGYGYAAYASPYALYGRKKREAEADADASALLYASPYGYAGHYGYAAAPYGYAGLPYAYAAYTHPSNLGLCTNYLGVQVPC